MKAAKFRFIQDIHLDNRDGRLRVLARKGDEFTAELRPETKLDFMGAEPKEIIVPGKSKVVSSDTDFHPGCLTSCIRTGTAIFLEEVVSPAPASRKKLEAVA